MYRAMIFKELREIRGIILLALAAYAFFITRITGCDFLLWGQRYPSYVPFAFDHFSNWIAVISGIFAVALGFRQTLGESIAETYPFLLHRPADRRWLIGMKLLTGVTAFWVCAALPILIYALWAATPGTHPGPFFWSMTAGTWEILIRLPLFYLAAFLSGLRPGRWLGTRLLPLAASLTAFFFFVPEVAAEIWGTLVVLVFDAVFLVCIFRVARERDY